MCIIKKICMAFKIFLHQHKHFNSIFYRLFTALSCERISWGKETDKTQETDLIQRRGEGKFLRCWWWWLKGQLEGKHRRTMGLVNTVPNGTDLEICEQAQRSFDVHVPPEGVDKHCENQRHHSFGNIHSTESSWSNLYDMIIRSILW